MNHCGCPLVCAGLIIVGLVGPSFETQAVELPRLFPDYVGITLPPNIAPLNFRIQEPAEAYRIELRSTRGAPISITGPSPVIRISPKAWANLVRANPGQPFYWDIAARTSAAGWTRFATVTNHIAQEEIDPWLAYRLLKPIYSFYRQLGLYQRDLESFEERRVLEKEKYGEGCLNCHTPLNQRPDTFAFNLRAHAGKSPMILVRTNQVARVERTMGYLAWHPSGRWLVFSVNKFSLFYHTRGETQDVYDAKSDLGLYDLEANTVVLPPAIAASDRNETWPAWSPDGRYLYFSSAAPQPVEKYRDIRYDLVRISFELETGQWGQPEIMISSVETGLSVCQPKISPDGRWLVVTQCKYGNFPIHQPSSDLWVMDLGQRTLRRLDLNSDRADTWHSWSSNSRWLVFSSKRLDGLLARPYFSYVDEQGRFHKPFVLPQEDPTFYGFYLQTFNVPELMQGPVTVKERDLVRAVVAPHNVLIPQGAAGAALTDVQPGQDHSGYSPQRE